MILKQFLAIETATEACSVALVSQHGRVGEHVIAPKKHAEIVLPMIQSLLNEAGCTLTDLDGILVGTGPGSFTGIRMGLSVAQGLCMASGIPAFGISTLVATALSAFDFPLTFSGSVVVAIDARMGEVYAQSFRAIDGMLIPDSQPQLGSFQKCLAHLLSSNPLNGPVIGVGNGFERYQDELTGFEDHFSDIKAEIYPTATQFSQHVQHAPLHYAALKENAREILPHYVRDQVADVSVLKSNLSSTV